MGKGGGWGCCDVGSSGGVGWGDARCICAASPSRVGQLTRWWVPWVVGGEGTGGGGEAGRRAGGMRDGRYREDIPGSSPIK